MVKVVRVTDPVPSVRIDRGTDYGNPFVMRGESMRDEVCDKFEQYAMWRLTIQPKWLKPLRGRNLACWCAPKRCHGDTLIRLANDEKRSK